MLQIMHRVSFFQFVISVVLFSDIITLSLRIQPYRVSFILGGPAAGKSTQCKKLVDDYGCIHLSAGDLLREERASGSSTATLIESYINEGAIVPVAITLDLIRSSMEKSKASRFLIDGFPRNEDNFLGWTKVMTEESCIVDSIIFLECPEEECIKRIIQRAKTSGRSDDNMETLAKRFVTFNEITLPVIKNFERTSDDPAKGVKSSGGKGVYRIYGDRDEQTVYNDMKHAYEDMVISELEQLSNELLEAENTDDKDCYDSLVDPGCTVITSASRRRKDESEQTESNGNVANLVKPHVRVMGKSAVVSYTRFITSGQENSLCEETRVWQLNDEGRWKNVHLHRVALL
jgi:UMP-CMP kinase